MLRKAVTFSISLGVDRMRVNRHEKCMMPCIDCKDFYPSLHSRSLSFVLQYFLLFDARRMTRSRQRGEL